MTLQEKKDILSDFCNRQAECAYCSLHAWCEALAYWEEMTDDVADEGLKEMGFVMEEPPEEPVEPEVHDNVNHPEHYNREGGMECIDEMVLLFGKDVVRHFCLCNAWKYRYRANNKNGDEDLKKADWYINKYGELV